MKSLQIYTKYAIVLIIAVFAIIVVGVAICAGLMISELMQNPMDLNKETNYPESLKFIKTISGKNLNLYAGSMGDINIDVAIPDSPVCITGYKGVFLPGDLVNEMPGDFKARKNVISEEDAPEAAVRILEQYGGLPPDAILNGAVTNYRNLLDPQTWEVIDTVPLDTSVSWWRIVDGRPVVGDRDIIQVILGENGELVRIYKRWRTYTPTGNVPVIPFSKAMEKLEKGEILNPTMGIGEDVYVYSTILGYYVKGLENPEITLEPVWIFYGNTASGSYLSFQIYARQFADFTATPKYGTAPLTVTFTDTSDASPINWNWDFGDGTTSTEQTPVHTYTTAGAYTVTLKATNYLGSDTMIKTSYILIGKKAIVTKIGMKLDEFIAVVNAMQFDNGIKKSLIQKLDNAKAKNDDALKFISQNKEKQANNMLNAEDNLMQAFTNEVDAQAGKGISTEDAAKLTAMAEEIQELIREAIGTPL